MCGEELRKQPRQTDDLSFPADVPLFSCPIFDVMRCVASGYGDFLA